MKVETIVPQEEFSERLGMLERNFLTAYSHNLITQNVLTDEELNERKLLKELRLKFFQNDTGAFQLKRYKFLNTLATRYWNPPIYVNEMYKHSAGILKSPMEIYNYFDIYFNTRTITPGDILLDIDCPDSNLGLEIIIAVSLNLLNDNKHFSVWNANSRAPQIRIYFVKELEKEEALRRRIIRELFWKKYVPNKFWKYVDKTMFSDGKTCQLEFAPHWKTREIFNILFEYIPSPGYTKIETKLNLIGGKNDRCY